jgi:BirA family biotin operon repressor/biotin-[acetyl-CoA-carboxylase] ligase
VCALATAETLEAGAGLETRVKWPNDVLVHDAKAAGILLEHDGDVVIAGLGINVDQVEDDLPQETRLPAVSLRTATGRRHERAPLLAALLARLEERYGEWKTSGVERIAEQLEARNWLRGRRVETGEGTGVARSIMPDGRLEILLDTGATALVGSGEVTVLR